MTEFTEMHIFFVVTTIAVVFVSAVVVVGLIRVVRILGHVERIAKLAAEESELVRQDVDMLRGRIRDEGIKFGALFDFFRARVERMAGVSKRGSKKKKPITKEQDMNDSYGKEESHDA